MVAASLVILVYFSGCAAPEPRLIGRWRSNRPLTIETLPYRGDLAPVQRAFVEGLFGRLTVTYTQRDIQSDLPSKDGGQPFHQSSPYRVVASDAESVTITIQDALSGQPTTYVIHFDGPDRYWISLDKGGREYFDRLKP